MIIGRNEPFNHNNQEYHIQIEDLGVSDGRLEIRVYTQGEIVWQKRVPHGKEITPDMADADRGKLLKAQIDKLVNTIEAAIVQNKLG